MTTKAPEKKTGEMIADRIDIIDVDCHIQEPVDIWTSRVSKKWGKRVPHVRAHPETGKPVWFINEEPSIPVAGLSMAGWKEWPPSHPPTLEEADHAAWDSTVRLERMDDYGIHTEILYPNVGGFGNQNFMKLEDPKLMLECIQAYNDFQVDWCSVDPTRLIPTTAIPFWDVDATVKEIERCTKMGHRGIIMTGGPENFGSPYLGDPHWEPVWTVCEELGVPVNFHLGSGGLDVMRDLYEGTPSRAKFAKGAVSLFIGNTRHVMDIIVSGMCQRHPNLNFVSVESGIGWVPFLLEAVDWQWHNSGVVNAHPEFDLLPSEYFKRQIYACFWFEEQTALNAIEQLGPDNFLYETDFPHPTSMAPGPASIAVKPKDYVEKFFSQMPEESWRKILRENAMRVYNLDD